MKKLTLATVALWTLFGVADLVSAQSDPDPVEPDTPGRCGDGDVGDSFATAHDLGNVETWLTPDNPPGDKVLTVVSEFECSGDLDVYRFQISSLSLIAYSSYLNSSLVNTMELYDSGGNFVGSRYGSGRQASLFPGIYYVAVANQPLAEHRTETGRYEFTLENWPLIQEIQPTTARSPDGPVAVLMNLSPWQAVGPSLLPEGSACLRRARSPVYGPVRVQRDVRGACHMECTRSAEDDLLLLAEQDGERDERQPASSPDGGG